MLICEKPSQVAKKISLVIEGYLKVHKKHAWLFLREAEQRATSVDSHFLS